jgi:hypothetical protein
MFKSKRNKGRSTDHDMLGKWDGWYQNLTEDDMGAFQYGDTETYRMAADFLSDMEEVEDWGCGAGGFKRFYKGRYIGLDGSHTPFADKVVDLRLYRSKVDGIVMRHVLEHNYDWKDVLSGAVASFTKKMCLILFTPFVPETHEIAHNLVHGVDVPDIAFRQEDIQELLVDCSWELAANLSTETGYGQEHVYFLTRC